MATTRGLVVAALLCAAPVAARANPIVFSNGLPDLSNGYFFGGTTAEFIVDFSLIQPDTLTGVNYWTLGAPGDTYWAIYADNGGSPVWGGTPLATGLAASTSTVLGPPVFGLDPFHNFISISAALGPGTYWLGLGGTGSTYWAPSASGPIGEMSWIHQLTTAGDYTSGYISSVQSQEYAFTIEGAQVPEPGTLTLVGVGLAGVLVRRWRKRATT